MDKKNERLLKHHCEQLRIGGYLDEEKLLVKYATEINLDAEFKYLCDFARQGDFFFQIARNQLRSLWTAYCFHANLDVDTLGYDCELREVWNNVQIPNDCTDFENFESFDHFMCAELV